MDHAHIRDRAAQAHLAVLGGFHPDAQDLAPQDTGTLILLGPLEPGFWSHVTAEPEFTDGTPDPLDRWSRRVIDALARDLGAEALYPFDGPPYAPFIAWAKRSGRAWSSPVGLLVHDEAGLMASWRGALALPETVALPAPPAASPCVDCAKPCLSACPVSALTVKGYDTKACHDYLDTADGQDCMTRGCAVRRACPVSRSYGRKARQSAFHMRSFHP